MSNLASIVEKCLISIIWRLVSVLLFTFRVISGNEGILEMQVGQIVDIEDIVRLFEPRFGSKLTNANTGVMARMFFFDSCRGDSFPWLTKS